MMKSFLLLLSICAGIAFVSCTKDVGPNPDLLPVSSVGCDSVTYTKHIKPIVVNQCVSCHYPGSGNPGGDLNTYSDLKTISDAGLLKARVIDQVPSVMPQAGPLPKTELDLIKCWIEAGAPNN